MVFFHDSGVHIDVPFQLISLTLLAPFLQNIVLAFRFFQKFSIFSSNPACRNKKCKGKIMNTQMRKSKFVSAAQSAEK